MTKSKKRTTYQDVARVAGVSASVVSYVVNNGPRPASAEARERVLKAIHDLDYHPNAMARGLRARRTNTIGYIVNDYNAMDVFTSPYSARILTGLTAELKRQNHYVLVYPMGIGEDPRALETLLRSERLDGVVIRLVQDAPQTDALIGLVTSTNVACVTIERPASARFNVPAVTYDDRQGAILAVSYLVERGHRRVGYICGDCRYATARARLAGYRQALVSYGIAPDEALIYGGDDWSPQVAALAVERFLALPEPPTAIFAASDDFALHALDVLRSRHIRVPEDIALIGFDDVQAAEESRPPLTTVRIPLMDMGRRAADVLLAHIQQDDTTFAPVETVPIELIRRQSA